MQHTLSNDKQAISIPWVKLFCLFVAPYECVLQIAIQAETKQAKDSGFYDVYKFVLLMWSELMCLIRPLLRVKVL